MDPFQTKFAQNMFDHMLGIYIYIYIYTKVMARQAGPPWALMGLGPGPKGPPWALKGPGPFKGLGPGPFKGTPGP